MSDTPLTIPNLIAAMKEAGFVTEERLEERLQVSNHRLKTEMGGEIKAEIQSSEERVKKHMNETLAQYHEEQIQPEFNRVNSRLDKVDDTLIIQNSEISGVKHSVDGLKADLSTTVSLETFTELKRKVNKNLPD
jgi:hypothetical protein